jgi:hypothetical protein
VDDARAGRSVPVTLPGMSIEMPAAEVYGLAHTLRGTAADAEEIGHRLGGRPRVGGPLQAPVEAFLESHRAAGAALAGELDWLGATVAAIADSWVRLDGTVMPSLGRVPAE